MPPRFMSVSEASIQVLEILNNKKEAGNSTCKNIIVDFKTKVIV